MWEPNEFVAQAADKPLAGRLLLHARDAKLNDLHNLIIERDWADIYRCASRPPNASILDN